MPRVKRGVVSRRKHKKLLSQTKGFRGTKRKLVKVAHEAVLHSGEYAFHGRKLKKRDFRALWITRISEAVKKEGLSYSVFIDKLKKQNIDLDRKMLHEILLNDPKAFKSLIDNLQGS